ncbi:MAG TPA: thermonuclease family protein [Rhodocyclaceae bacterium]|nr:thermonuclease family protein [Rhodocyclaceae bacterium]
MDRATLAFWILVGVLLGTASYFGINAEAQRRQAQRSEAPLENGDLVKLERIVDGDTVVVNKNGAAATVRLVGLKVFDTRSEKDVAAVFGRAAEDRLRALTANQSLRVSLYTPPKDRYGRTLATLYAEDRDIALVLIREGLGLVYTVFPFPAMTSYQSEQAQARAAGRGLWAHREAMANADALMKQMHKATP